MLFCTDRNEKDKSGMALVWYGKMVGYKNKQIIGYFKSENASIFLMCFSVVHVFFYFFFPLSLLALFLKERSTQA